MDGRKRVVLWKKGNIPASLVFDSKGMRIFWADLGEDRVTLQAYTSSAVLMAFIWSYYLTFKI